MEALYLDGEGLKRSESNKRERGVEKVNIKMKNDTQLIARVEGGEKKEKEKKKEKKKKEEEEEKERKRPKCTKR